MSTEQENLEKLVNRRYEHGFVTDIASESLPPGLDEGVVRAISARKNEPEFMLEWRLRAGAVGAQRCGEEQLVPKNNDGEQEMA